jgi:cyclophilin family peptidyl-prolyl cis-trans isomerase/HEAT repeat protein
MTGQRLAGAFFLTLITFGCASTPVSVEPTIEDKLARLLKLEDERSLGGGEVNARLRDPAGRVRARAALVLARIGEPGAAAAIAPLLDDGTPYTRGTAAFALGLLEEELSEATLRRLTEATRDEDPSVRARAYETIGKKGGSSAAETIARAIARSVPRGAEPYEWDDDMTVSALRYPHHDLRLAILALARLESLRWSWDILATEGETPRFVWWPAAWALSELEGEQRAPLLTYYSGSRNPEFRLWGARGLRTLHMSTGTVLHDRLPAMLSDPNERVRIAAVRAAASMERSEVVPALLKLLERDTHYVQAVVLEALTTLSAPAAVEPLLDRLGSESRWLRALVLPALARQDPAGFWLLLAGLGADLDWEVRAALADLLGRMTGERAVELLRTMVDASVESDARVRSHALAALARRDPEGAVSVLIQHLSADDPFEKLAAALALESLGASEAAAPVQAAFLVADADEPRVKAGLLAVFATLDPASGGESARSALDDTSYLVRREAAAIVMQAGDAHRAIRSRPSALSLDAYRSYVSPHYSPQAFIRTELGVIELELFVLDAPMTVRNFVRLARDGFYNGLTVEDVVPNGYIHTGDPRGDKNGGPGYVIRSEINRRPIVRGTVAMANHGKDTGGSRFFITHLPQPDLDGRNTVFGQVTSGMEIVDRLEPGDTILDIAIWDGFTSPYREP